MSTERTPIEPSDIRAGDLLRFEFSSPPWPGSTVAFEWRSQIDGEGYNGRGEHYLLGRSEPVVELPSTPTLGWVTTDVVTTPALGTWATYTSTVVFREEDPTEYLMQSERDLVAAKVRTFTPATAVPTAALERLREALDLWVVADRGIASDVSAFLKAVDGAGS